MVLLGNSIKKKEKLKPIKNKMLVFLGKKVSLSPSFFHKDPCPYNLPISRLLIISENHIFL